MYHRHKHEATQLIGDTDILSAWQTLWQRLGATQPVFALGNMLIARYREAHRHYHRLQHLQECFAQLRPVREFANHPDEIELALWFHDAIYDVRRHDNEALSAAWARDSIVQAGLGNAVAARVHALIMATRHDAVPIEPDAQLLVDIDLAILGASSQRFDEYERQVRLEYAWVPDFLFNRTRRKILAQFLARKRLFQTQHFHAQLEATARANLSRSLKALGA